MTYSADIRQPHTMIAAQKAYRADHPEIEADPGQWLILWAMHDGGKTHITGHRLKTDADHAADERLDRCCCHPDQPRGHA